MGKKIVKFLIIIILLLAVVGFFEFRAYRSKCEVRQEGMVYFNEKDYVKAIDYFEKALDKHFIFSGSLDNDIRCYMAECYGGLEEYDQAMEITRELIEDDDDVAEYYLLSGGFHEVKKEYDAAVEDYQKGFDQTGDGRFPEKICGVYLLQEDYDSALSYAKEGLERDGASKKTLMYQLIIIYEHIQDYEAAYQAAKEYNALYPDDEKGIKELKFLSTRL